MNITNTDRIEKQLELRAAPARVWRALTDYREFGAWFHVNLTSPFIPGQTVRGQITYPGYEHIVMEIAVEDLAAEGRFSFRWHPYAIDPQVDYSAEVPTLVVFTLKPLADYTLLTVTETGFDALPPARREQAFRMNDDGWAEQLESIETYLAQEP